MEILSDPRLEQGTSVPFPCEESSIQRKSDQGTDWIRIKVTFRDAKGNDIKTIEGNEGDDLLSLAHEHDVDLEG